jgi:hypothetical protein
MTGLPDDRGRLRVRRFDADAVDGPRLVASMTVWIE